MLGGLAGGTVGFFAGGLAGAALCSCEGGEGFDELWAAFLGAAAGTAISIPIGVHLANGRHGNLGYSLAASLAIGAVGVLTAVAVNDDTASPAIILVIPVSQIATSVLIERKTTR